jgi:alpha-tubulin suppressor-like RCC1 family protein
LIYYKIAKIRAGQGNSALVTDKGELLLHGMNEYGQLGQGQELGKALYFFGDFMKRDNFTPTKDVALDVLDAVFGSFHTLVLCRDKQKSKNRVFGCGNTEFG